ncbi:pH-response regulator protein palA/prr-like protein [Emericellopsis cladophorae]|uniref:PH-response regulator protein palA/prr-like protein n=1 Tax=Emericellopsis cladophorae TaxID=2686198 RepID=A0A9Q0BCC1_9HYPO|nr:pH-response regulator protein palA/prr-like protein [Emericellopsis cladophorae]KAI6778954.1 pH-response regulator protein palA/prr-like protein [Emericellopsis cladophorae]
MLSLPFRKGTHISLASVIRQYINEKYDQHPDMFKRDLEFIDDLRQQAVNVHEPHASGVAKLTQYAAQLVWIGGKFPIDIGAEFTWYPALGYNIDRPLVRNNLKFELMNALFNLAALYAQLALNTPRGNTEGLKTAANYFSQAAGVISHIQSVVLPELRMSDPPEDMDANTLESLNQLMLAQSQECFWQKAVLDGYRDASIAKLASRVSDLYIQASEAAIKSDAVSSAWIHHMSAKHHHFAAAAQYRAACDCLEKSRFGEEVARLTDALACVNDGLREARGGFLGKTVVDDLNGLKKKVEADLKRAEKDNDMIYLNPVPPKSDLKILERANMAIARIPPQVADPYKFFGDHAEFGPALFSRLVPFSVHVAISIYEERRDRMVNQEIIQRLESLTEKIHTLFEQLGLPGSLQAVEKPIGLPQSLVQHAEDIRQADAVERVRRSFADIDKLRSADMMIFEEGKAALAAEEEEDQRLRAKYGTDRWARPDSLSDARGSELRRVAGEIEGYLNSSIGSDGIVKEKFAGIEGLLGVLSGPDRVLMDFVPSSRRPESSDEIKLAVGKLRSAYSDILRLESRRRKKVETLRDNARRDDIKPDMLKEAARLERTYPTTALVPAHFEYFFDQRLDKLYEPEIQAIDKEEEEQEKALSAVERANREFESQKRQRSSQGTREREAALQKLENAYVKYKEVINNLETARKFYNDLNKIVGQGFRDQVKKWVADRHMDARALEEDINMPTLSNLAIGQQPMQSPPAAESPFYAAQSPPPQSNQQASHIQSWASPQAAHPAASGAHMQQPKPVAPQTWNPGMGMKFGQGAPVPFQSAQGQQQGQQQQSPQPPPQQQQQHKTWNPSSGIRFG